VSDNRRESPPADQQAVLSVARGDVNALGELYDRHAHAVYALALRIVSNQSDAEEIVQDVFVQAWRQSARYDAFRGSVVAWLLMMTRTRAIDRLRSRQARQDALADDQALPGLSTSSASQEALAIDRQTVQALKGALDTLPDLLRAPIELAYYEGLSHSAIAQRLGQPLGTVKSRVRTALAKLRGVFDLDGRP
jgi:RNA polymerase sigma-70 factor (ECF subfamily)